MNKEVKKIVVDIDGTICTHEKDYNNAKPIMERIEFINELYNAGVYVAYHTARGTGSGADYKELTQQQLKEWGVEYNELTFGKPVADLYIDDKAFSDKQLDIVIKLKQQTVQKEKELIEERI